MDTKIFTYPELARLLGQNTNSVRTTVRRKRWQKHIANDGTVRVAVPLDELPATPVPRRRHALATPLPPPDIANPVHAQIARLEAELATARALIDRADAARHQAETDRDLWREQLAAELAKPLWKRLFG